MSLGQPGPGQSDAAQSGQASSPAAESQPQAGGAEPGDSNPAQGNNPPQQGSRAGGSRGGPQRGGPRAGNVNNGGYGGVIDRQGEPVRSPIGGQDFIDWSDRLRDVEEMVDDPELRAEAARIRDAARSIRIEMKRHSSAPQWNLVRVNVAEPLVELSNRVADELLRRQSKQALVPLDRDPVPPKYSEKTRKYYERLGSGQ